MFRCIINKIRLSQRGQTSVEYLLLIVVAVSFGLTFAKKMDEYLIKNPNGLIAKPLNLYKSKLKVETRYQRYDMGPIAQ